jgi:hypothetical protein
VHDTPLAFADFRTIDMGLDTVDAELIYPQLKTIIFRHNPAQMWYYLRDQMPGEVWMFKCFESDVDKARFAPHTAFLNPLDGIGLPRQSIELRALVCYE